MHPQRTLSLTRTTELWAGSSSAEDYSHFILSINFLLTTLLATVSHCSLSSSLTHTLQSALPPLSSVCPALDQGPAGATFVQLSSGVTKAEEGSDGGWWTPPTNHHPHAGGPSSVRDSTWLDEQQQFDNLRFLFQFQEKNHLSSISTCYVRCEPQAQQFVYWIQSTILPWSLTFYWSKWLS